MLVCKDLDEVMFLHLCGLKFLLYLNKIFVFVWEPVNAIIKVDMNSQCLVYASFDNKMGRLYFHIMLNLKNRIKSIPTTFQNSDTFCYLTVSSLS